ncbi:hypothetical protein [uncultured Anaerobiospirillum sp.]|uniref:hypothetical protein n=1 Tax=uncultured Anaerobiospirillum sp. TaxID=265728 RepID=UPI00280503F7|nr:hypothetical protein [uncultured Anaerobiospirillum sp.]
MQPFFCLYRQPKTQKPHHPSSYQGTKIPINQAAIKEQKAPKNKAKQGTKSPKKQSQTRHEKPQKFKAKPGAKNPHKRKADEDFFKAILSK